MVPVGRYYAAATVPLTPKPYKPGQYKATIFVHYGTRTLTRTITVDPGLSLVRATSSNNSTDTVDLEVRFTGKAPKGGLAVRLASSNHAVTVPPRYTFPAGSSGGRVAGVTAEQVTTDTTVRLSATLGGRTLGYSTVLLPPVFGSRGTMTISSFGAQNILYGNDQNVGCVVTLSAPAPVGGVLVRFSSSSPEFPANTVLLVAAGDTQGYFPCDPPYDVPSPIHATLTATADGVTATLPVTIEPGLESITGVPRTLVGGDAFTATITMQGPVDTPVTVEIFPTELVFTTGHQYVTIEPGQSSATVTFTSVPVQTNTYVYFFANLNTSSIDSEGMTVTPPPS